MAKTSRIIVVLAIVAAAGFGRFYISAAESGEIRDSNAARRITSVAKEDNRAMEHLDHLVNDIGSRPVNCVGYLEACKWAHDEFKDFGLANVHIEKCGEIEGDFSEEGARARFKRVYRSIFGKELHGDMVPICNVIADLPGTESPDEYVICGAHLDSAPQGPGATDNGAGVAAVMEAARLLASSGVKPVRTIRFILFGGEEAGLVGSNGYVEDHPEVMPKVSAVYNLDRGASYICGIAATAPLLADMREIFADAMRLDPEMPFEVEEVDYLPKADPNCCAALVQKEASASGKRRVVAQPGCGAKSACGALDGIGEEGGLIVKEVTADGDTLVKRIIIPGAPGAGKDLSLESILEGLDLEALGVSKGQIKADGDSVRKIVALGSSDHAPFLAAGIPAFWWNQGADATVPYPAHTGEDTYDKVNPRHLEHSAAIIALGAFRTASLDHMLSREKLTAPEGAGEDAKAIEEGARSPSRGDKEKKPKPRVVKI